MDQKLQEAVCSLEGGHEDILLCLKQASSLGRGELGASGDGREVHASVRAAKVGSISSNVFGFTA